ncbi:MAG: Ig-like domain-containing protein [Clostridiales bacterium]|nr:Ig-like domain-containing protein [Clostridiales bacterium]
MKRTDKNNQNNLEDTLEFLSLDDDTIASYEKKSHAFKSRKSSRSRYEEDYEDEEVDYEDEDYEDEEVDYEDEDYEDEEDDEEVDYEDEDYEDEEDDEEVDYEDEDYEDEEDDEEVDYEDEDYEDEEDDEEVDYEDEDYEDEEDGDEVDYEDEDYEDDDDEEVDYEDEDYEDDDDEEVDYEDEEDYEHSAKYTGSAAERIVYFFKQLTPLDYVVGGFGCFILIAAIIVGNIYLTARAEDKQVEAFAEVGTEVESIEVIGESGLIAVADAESARLSQMLVIGDEAEEQETNAPEEEKVVNVIEVGINITTIKSDIKIKFDNKKTNKLIGGVPFEVEVVGSNKTYNLKDDDKDGIIYQNGIAAGTYTVKVVALTDEAYSKYSLPSESQTVKVIDTIEYKKVDVEDEIKTEAEINVAVEDTAQQNTEIESVLTDTVEWVPSTKTELNSDSNYTQINASDIPDPATIARAAGFMKFTSTPSTEGEKTVSGNEGGVGGDDTLTEKPTDPTVEPKPTEPEQPTEPKPTVYTKVTIAEGDSTSIEKGSTKQLSATTEPAGGTVTWSSDNGNVTVDGSGKITGVTAGTATITAECSNEDNSKVSEKITVTVTEPVIKYTSLTISGDNTVRVGKTIKLTAKSNPEGGKVEWTSSNTGIAKIDADGTITGVTVGEVTITGTCGDAKAEWKVKVVNDAASNYTSKLKDKNGNQIYIKKSDGSYAEAVYADYYTNSTFYLRNANASYSYTGWQTIDGYTYFFDKNGNYVTGEQVIQGAKYSFDATGRLSSGSGVLGIDVSKWNGSIDWNAVKNSGISYAIIRCGYRGSTTGALIEDPKFRANIQGAQNAGIKVGVYFFTQAVNDVEAVEEASMVLSLIKGYNLSLPVFLDVEPSSGRGDAISADSRTAVCQAFCQTIQNSGYKAGIYANKTWLESYINAPALTSYKIWLAQYAAAPTYTRTRVDMWQYSSKGTIGGINGNVDMNINYMN